jgi:hypothetical protein
MLSTEPNQELLMRFIINVYGLDLVRDIVQDAFNTHNDEGKEFRTEDIFDADIDPNTKEGKKILSAINGDLSKLYTRHLGLFYDVMPSSADGSGSHMVILEASIPAFKARKKSIGGFDVVPDEGLGSPPMIGRIASRLNRNNSVSDFFGLGTEKDPGFDYLQRAQEAMLEYVRANASGELGGYSAEAELKTEYLKKIAHRRKSWERMILTMGMADIDVDDLVG